MKIWLMLIVFLCLMAVSTRGLAQQNTDTQTATNKCFDKLFKDGATLIKDNHRIESESDRDEINRIHYVDYTEKVYEYSMIADIPVRRLISSNKPIFESDRQFRSFVRAFDFDRTFFDRFDYSFKQRSTSHGVAILTYSFSPKVGLKNVHLIDIAASKLVGEVDIREKDFAFLVMRAHLSSNKPINVGLFKVTTGTIIIETKDFDTLTVLRRVRVEADYRYFLSDHHWSKAMDLISVEKNQPQEVKQTVVIESEPITKYVLADEFWQQRWLILFLLLGGSAVVGYGSFRAYRVYKNRKNVRKS